MKNIIYLRKSRADLELEKMSNVDVLKSHEKQLIEYAKNNNILIKPEDIRREVVSGDTIDQRPVIQQVLREVESGTVESVLVMEVDRLARGDTIDQGVISKTFKYTNTKIRTIQRTYNPNNEADEEYFEFGLFMARREYKLIKRRIQFGRVRSVKDGKWPNSVTPYGYNKIKLKNQKGYILVINEDEAKTVRLIFDLLINENMGTSKIANRLNELNIKPRKQSFWTPAGVRNILSSEAVHGYITWSRRALKKELKNGVVRSSRPISDNYLLIKGLHEPIIDEDTWKKAKKVLSGTSVKTVPNDKILKNPLAGLIICGKCGRKMLRRNYVSKRQESLICTATACKNVSSDLCRVENRLIKHLKEELRSYKNYIANYEKEIILEETAKKNQVEIIKEETDKLNKQLDKACEFVETGVYNTETFLKRTNLIKEQLENLEKQKNEIDTSTLDKVKIIKMSIPKIENILATYNDSNLTAEQKNMLLKTIVEKVIYIKEKGGRGYEENFHLEVYLKF